MNEVGVNIKKLSLRATGRERGNPRMECFGFNQEKEIAAVAIETMAYIKGPAILLFLPAGAGIHFPPSEGGQRIG